MTKKRVFVRYTKAGKIVPGSMIITQGDYPEDSAVWYEIPADLCCTTTTTAPTTTTSTTAAPTTTSTTATPTTTSTTIG